jgi:hypothetical protein
MDKSKITKGEITIHPDTLRIMVRDDEGVICNLPMPSRYEGQDERYFNEIENRSKKACLIQDAFNVFTKTDKTPSELMEENLKMRERLIECKSNIIMAQVNDAKRWGASDEKVKEHISQYPLLVKITNLLKS